MIAFLSLLEKKFGGVEAYLKDYPHLTDDEIQRLKQSMLVPKT
jgi:hypothetical protein